MPNNARFSRPRHAHDGNDSVSLTESISPGAPSYPSAKLHTEATPEDHLLGKLHENPLLGTM